MTTARLSLCVWVLASAALMVSPAAGQTPALWTGGAGTASYNDAANWDTPAVPVNGGGTTYSVTIPAGAAVEFDVPGGPQQVTDFELGNDATLTVNPGRSLTVLDFAEIYGLVTTDNGTFNAPAAAAQFPSNRARAHVSGGGSIHVAAPSYSSTGRSERGTFTILSATGAGSTLDLSELLAIADNHNHGNYEQIHVISATGDGVIDLSKVQSLSGPTRDVSDRLDIVVNTGGNIMLDALQSTTAGTGEVRFNLNLPSYTLGALTDANNTRFILADAMTLNVPVLETYNGEGFNLGDNATVDAPLLESLTWSEINPGAGATFDAPSLVDISGSVVNLSPAWTLVNGTIVNLDNARLSVSGGVQFGTAFSDVSATSYSSTGFTARGTYTILSATGTGTVLDLSSVLTIADNHNHGNYEQIHQIRATSDGVVDLSNVETVSGPTRDESDRLDVVVNTGGNVILDALRSTTAGTGEVRFSIDVPTYGLPALETAVNTQFNLSDGRTLNLPLLNSHTGEGYSLGDGATVNAPVLVTLTNAVLSAGAGATFDAPNLTDISGSVLNLSPAWTLVNGTIVNLNNARLSVSGGVQFGTAFSDVSATSYSSTGFTARGTYTILSATGTGTVLDLSSAESLLDNHNHGNYEQIHQIRATSDGVVDLSNVETVSGPTREEADRLDFVVNTGGNILLDSLRSTTAGAGEVRFSLDVPTYGLPALETTTNTQFNLSDGRTLNLPLLVSHNGEGYSLGDGATVDAPVLTTLTNAVLSAGAGATFDAPNLVDITGSVLNVSPAWTLVNGMIGSMNNARLTVADGAEFGTAYGDVSATSYSSTGLSARGTYTILSATGTDTVLDLSSLQSLLDNHNHGGYEQVHRILATDNGLVDLSSVQDIAGPLREASDRLDFVINSGGRVDLSSLQSVTSGNGHVRFLVSAGGQLAMGDVTISNQMTLDVTDDTSLLEFVGNLHLDPTSSINVRGGAKVQIGGHFSFDYTDETRFACDTAIFQFDGTGEQWMEVGGENQDLPGPGAGNFGITQLIVGTETQATTVVLVDLIDNGNHIFPREALYLYGSGGLDGLAIPGESTLLLGDINVYALIDGTMEHLNAWFGPGITRVEYDQGWVVLPEPATLALLGLGGIGLLLRRRRTPR